MYQNTTFQWKCININIHKKYQTYCVYNCTRTQPVTMANSKFLFDDDIKNNDRKRSQDNRIYKV